MTRLSEVLDQNSAAFAGSLQFCEALLNVHQRVANDIRLGTVRTTTVGDVEQIDFGSYLVEYQCCLVFAQFAAWLVSLRKPEAPLIEPATEQPETIVFGGGP